MRAIILRFKDKDKLIIDLDKVAKILGNTNAGATRIAIYEFCNKILGDKKNESR
jgi:hypothetical protein